MLLAASFLCGGPCHPSSPFPFLLQSLPSMCSTKCLTEKKRRNGVLRAMKFMKLGYKPDTFFTDEGVRSVSSEVSCDLVIQVKGSTYLLHKFPLLSKSSRLQKLCAESQDSSKHQTTIQLPDFPTSVEAFELCAKFCYGIAITLSAHNIVAARCAAEYLEMAEELEKGNLIQKLEAFFNSCVLHGWKDTIVTLKSTNVLHIMSEELGITSRCIDSIISTIQTHPYRICQTEPKTSVSELPIDLYWRIMIGIKSSGKVPSRLIGESLQIYASRWFPSKQSASNMDSNSKNRKLLESIVSLLPSEKGAVTCSFLLKLLKAANKLGASSSSKKELARRVGIQLEDASVKDLLVPSVSQTKGGTKYDVEIVRCILEEFVSQVQSPPNSPLRSKGRFERRRRSKSAENVDLELEESRRSSSVSHSAKIKVARLVDRYLMEVGSDVNLPLSTMVSFAEFVPDFARVCHDDLYRAIDTFLKAHPDLTKAERKRLCRVLDCKRLSAEAGAHAAQNERLPLRVIVQVLFHEQARAATAGKKLTDLPANIKALLTEDRWSVSSLKSPLEPKLETLKMKLAEVDDEDGPLKAAKLKGVQPKRMFSKLLTMNRNASEKH